jgi:TrmH family RNA methyltransferase
MPRYEPITSFQNPKIKLAQKLLDKATREREQRFVVEYGRDLARAVQSGLTVQYVVCTPARLAADDRALLATLTCPIYAVSAELLSKASYRENPSGLVAVLAQQPPRADLNAIIAAHLLILVDLRKPGNVGALLRTADATGFTVLLVDSALDLYNPNIIRSSTGACFLDTIYTTTSAAARDFLRAQGYQTIATHLDGQQSLYTADFTRKSALVLGTEDTGLDDSWSIFCDQLVKIPMVGTLTDSLNVSVAGAIGMYEALRQKQFHSPTAHPKGS